MLLFIDGLVLSMYNLIISYFPGSGRDAGRGGDPDRSEGDWRRPSAAAPESGGGSGTW